MSTLELFATDWKDLWGEVPHQSVGAVYTKPAVVALILDLAGYTVGGGRLANRSILEPSCGDGAFLEAILTRLIASEREHFDHIDWNHPNLEGAIRAADIAVASVEAAKALVLKILTKHGCSETREQFDVIVGNPPYVRLEDLPKAILRRYRQRYSTATDRADLYIAFFQRGLELLSNSGVLAFICANRFTKNTYGAALRRLIARRYHVRHYVNLEHTQPFLTDVSAYPAIFVVDRDSGKPTRAVSLDQCDRETLDEVRHQLTETVQPGCLVAEFGTWYPNGERWRTTSKHEHQFLTELESRFPTLEQSGRGTKVGIGVATGADEVFVLPEQKPAVEASRQIPTLVAQDIAVDKLSWSGKFLVNPFADNDDGTLVDLDDYPGLHDHLFAFEDRLKKRHVARSRPGSWYRTIDRIWPALCATPKLVIPDIQPGGVVGLDAGLYYPHHNVYWITSESWDLRALQALLRSTLVLRQVKAFSVQMRGGFLRYQAQTLRRIRIPDVQTLTESCIDRLISVGASNDQQAIDDAAAEAFKMRSPLSHSDQVV